MKIITITHQSQLLRTFEKQQVPFLCGYSVTPPREIGIDTIFYMQDKTQRGNVHTRISLGDMIQITNRSIKLQLQADSTKQKTNTGKKNTSRRKETSVHDQATSIIHLHLLHRQPSALQALQVIPPIKLCREEACDKIHVTS